MIWMTAKALIRPASVRGQDRSGREYVRKHTHVVLRGLGLFLTLLSLLPPGRFLDLIVIKVLDEGRAYYFPAYEWLRDDKLQVGRTV